MLMWEDGLRLLTSQIWNNSRRSVIGNRKNIVFRQYFIKHYFFPDKRAKISLGYNTIQLFP